MIAAWLWACAQPEPRWVAPDAPSPLRRLTASQVENALGELFPGVALPDVQLPVEPRVGAFDNQAAAQAPSPLLAEDLQRVAIEVTAAAVASPGTWSPCPRGGGPDPEGCGREVVGAFARRALRRPLTEAERAPYQDFFSAELAATGDFDAALQLALQAVLQDPAFLYLVETSPGGDGARVWLSGPEVAARMAVTLWNGIPDEALLAAAEAGELDDADGVERQARRMLADPRGEVGFLAFHRLWMDLDPIADVIVSPTTYEGWAFDDNPQLRDELEAFVREVWSDDAPRLSTLLLDRRVSASPDVAAVYGIAPGDDLLPADARAGFLTRAGWLSVTGHLVNPSPVLRGVFVLDRLLCSPPGAPPPEGVEGVQLDIAGAGTNRERYEAHLFRPACATCHDAIDGIGFGFEHYDSLGRWVATDDGRPVDATGVFHTADLDGVAFDGALELSGWLAASDDVARCHARQWWRYALGRADLPADAAVLAPLERELAADDDLHEWLVALVRSETFRSRVAWR